MMDRKRFFDDIAHDWEKEHQSPQEISRLRHLVKYFPLKKGDNVLDVGCGTGRLIPWVRAAIGDKGMLVESDFSREMLKIGKAKYSQRNICFIQSSAQSLAVKARIFDVIICFALFPHISDKLNALCEFRRILKPGKPLVIAHPMSREELNCFHSRIKGPVTQDFLPEDEEMKRLFEEAGFSGLSIKNKKSLYIAKAYA